MKNKYFNTFFNTIMLYLLTAAKIIFPLVTLPYLARVLSVECYGMVSYVKAVVGYAQTVTDFGFMFSAVKEVVLSKDNKDKVSKIIGDTVVSKLLLSSLAFIVILIVSNNIKLLNDNLFFLCLSMCVPVLSSFLMDFLFRGIEKMQIVTIIFVLMKTVSTLLTILLIKNDSMVLLIPIFDILSSLIAIIVTWIITRRLGYSFKFSNIKNCFNKIKLSFGYFANSMASTAFGAMNTVVMGVFIADAQEIAYWSVCMQLVGAVQSMYTPISNGIYPYMIKNKDFKLIKKILLYFMPIIGVCALVCYIIAPYILTIIAGEKYIAATSVFRWLIPVIVMSFLVAILGWPALGSIDKVKETTLSTILGAVVQIIGLIILACANCFTVINIAIWRNLSEFTMLFSRSISLYKYRYMFVKTEKHKEG